MRGGRRRRVGIHPEDKFTDTEIFHRHTHTRARAHKHARKKKV